MRTKALNSKEELPYLTNLEIEVGRKQIAIKEEIRKLEVELSILVCAEVHLYNKIRKIKDSSEEKEQKRD